MYEALKDYVLVEVLEAKEFSQGGIIMPQKQRNIEPRAGVVITAGPECHVSIQKGETVLFPKSAGIPIYVEGIECLILPEADLLLREV